MKYAKRIGVLICVISLCFTLMTAPAAHASGLLGGQAAGAWIAAGLVALNIVAHTGAQAIGSYFGWQEAPSTQSILNYAFPNSTQVISNYMNASTIKVDQGVMTIDGVQYDELWLGPEWSQALKTNLFDFKTKWEILSGNTGTLVSGAGYLGTCPIYNVNGVLRSQTFTISNAGGVIPGPTNFIRGSNNALDVSGLFSNSFTVGPSYFPISGYYQCSQNSYTHYFYWANGKRMQIFPTGQASFVNSPFNFDYVSGIVPADPSEIPDDYGISIKIPHDKLETFYNKYPEYNVDNTTINIQQDQIDINELTNAIFDLIESMDEIKAEWTNGEEPEPPAPVDPVENIDENVESINQYQQNMNQQVNHMHQDVEAIHQIQQQQKELQQQTQQIQQQILEDTSSIDSTLKNVTETPGESDLPSFKFDLRELFPFCIPFDIYRLLSSFEATPVAPHVQLPFVIQSIGFSYTLDLDFSIFDPVAQALRTAELIVYALGLAWATGKVIKW